MGTGRGAALQSPSAALGRGGGRKGGGGRAAQAEMEWGPSSDWSRG